MGHQEPVASASRVATLHHEALDDTMEAAALEADRLPHLAELARAKLPKVLRSARHDVRKQLRTSAWGGERAI